MVNYQTINQYIKVDPLIKLKIDEYLPDNLKQNKKQEIRKYFKEKEIKCILITKYKQIYNRILERVNKIIYKSFILYKGKLIKEVVKKAGECINNNYNKIIDTSPKHLFIGSCLYNLGNNKDL